MGVNGDELCKRDWGLYSHERRFWQMRFSGERVLNLNREDKVYEKMCKIIQLLEGQCGQFKDPLFFTSGYRPIFGGTFWFPKT